MCGRYSLTSPVEAVRRLFGLVPGDAMAARYNVAPSQVVPLVRRRGSGNEVAMLRWGLIPAWAKDPAIGHKMINARSETVAEKPAFRNAYRRRRCLVPADGFYEWKRLGGRKAPYRIVIGDGEPFALGPGQGAPVPPHTEHSLVNLGSVPACYLFVYGHPREGG